MRKVPTYKGKFAIRGKGSEFVIKSILVNGKKQTCYRETGIPGWPVGLLDNSTVTENSEIETSTQQFEQTTTQKSSAAEEPQPPSSNSCGQIKKVDNFGNFLDPVSSPGQTPWVVAIYRYIEGKDETSYKCAGTIVDKRTILTSVNCLLDDGFLLSPSDLKVYVAPFQLSLKIQKLRLYDIANIMTHEGYNFHLENNIAALRLSRDIKFNDFVQPICLPEKSFSVKGKIGKVCV